MSVYNERVGDLNLVTQQRDDLKKQYDEWRKRRWIFDAYLTVVISNLGFLRSINIIFSTMFSGWMNLWLVSTQFH